MSRLELVRDVNDAVIDVVFIHGLDGDGRTTWSHDGGGDPFWPGWLAEELEHVAVWTVHYDAWSTGYRGRSMPIKDRAMNIAALLGTENIGDRPLCFVAHSMGGLLVKELLMHSARDSTEFRTFAAMTRGVVFLATPHDGSSLATVLDGFRRVSRANPAIDELRRESSALLHLGNDYRDWAVRSGIQHQVYFEKHPVKGLFVVQPSSSNPGLPGVPPIGIDANHRSICKPLHRKELVYARVKKFVGSLAAEVTRPPPADLPDFVPDPIRGRGDIIDCLRAALDRPGTVMAELSGIAGIGKTAIATQIARNAAPDAYAIYLSARGYPGVTVNSLLESLAGAVTDPGERDRLSAGLPTPDANALIKLDEIIDRLGTDRVMVIVDDAERLRDDERRPRDLTLESLFAAIADRPGHQIQILFVTATPILERNTPHQRIRRGLQKEPFAEFLVDLEGDSRVLRGTMPTEELWRSVDGHPRVTELIYGIRASGSRVPVRQLASTDDPQSLADALLNSLDDLDNRIVRTLAVYGRPVLPAAVSALTGASEDEVRAALGRLHQRRIVRSRYHRFVLPTADEERLTGQIPDAELAEMRRRAAAYFEKTAEDHTPQSLHDLGDHLDAIDLHILAGNSEHALTLMSKLDRKHLKEWGQTGTLTPWLRTLTRRLTDPYDQVVNTSLLARALAQQGDLAAGIAMTHTALELNAILGLPEVQLALLLQMARYFFRAGAVSFAAERYQEVLDLSGADSRLAEAHLGLGLCQLETGQFDAAMEKLDAAETYLARCRPGDAEERLIGARILFARACISYERDGYRRCRAILVAAREARFQEAMKAATIATRPAGNALAAEAFVLLGIALVRAGASNDRAVQAFTEAAEQAGELLSREQSRYLVREVRGLALAGLAMLESARSEVPALLAFQRAIRSSDVPGACHRRRELFSTLVSGHSDDTLPRLRDLLE